MVLKQRIRFYQKVLMVLKQQLATHRATHPPEVANAVIVMKNCSAHALNVPDCQCGARLLAAQEGADEGESHCQWVEDHVRHWYNDPRDTSIPRILPDFRRSHAIHPAIRVYQLKCRVVLRCKRTHRPRPTSPKNIRLKYNPTRVRPFHQRRSKANIVEHHLDYSFEKFGKLFLKTHFLRLGLGRDG